ncbi:hypothetical protein GHI93_05040 [Lactococcus hircilactis]|uniref:XRE family transcriptional regulator n=1 Tax=Lactococcus hircilactis TaxID=1494462 RepID=A0A7X1Z8M6_9LACT|nr:hypothetical protein [Lactococcus hircilactis]MQW39304.1 hypothetical protein [Lactococcus hircilactis]
MTSESLKQFSSDEFKQLTEFQQEEITNNFKKAIIYKMKEKNLDIDTIAEKSNYSARQLSSLLYSDSVDYETHQELQQILAITNGFPD